MQCTAPIIHEHTCADGKLILCWSWSYWWWKLAATLTVICGEHVAEGSDCQHVNIIEYLLVISKTTHLNHLSNTVWQSQLLCLNVLLPWLSTPKQVGWVSFILDSWSPGREVPNTRKRAAMKQPYPSHINLILNISYLHYPIHNFSHRKELTVLDLAKQIHTLYICIYHMSLPYDILKIILIS